MPTPVHHTFGPHVDKEYLRKVLMLSYVPWKYIHGTAPLRLKNALREKFKAEPTLFGSGRESLYALLKALSIKPGEEVIIQGYTCVVVPNAIHAAGAVPVYADIDPDTLNLTTDTVRPLLTPRTRALVCQHTFGIPADIKALRKLCDERDIVLIEELVHAMPDQKGPDIGAYGDYVILSFGRDKAISGISGGAVLSRHPRTTAALLELERTAVHETWWNVARLLEYGTRMHSIVRPLSGTPLFKPAVWLLGKLRMITLVVTPEEKKGQMSHVVKKIPNVCAELALFSLGKLKSINERRRTLVSFFAHHGREHHWPLLAGIPDGLPLQKFPLFVLNARAKRAMLKKENIHLDDGWTGCVICPEDIELTQTGYEHGMDPAAERVCRQILSLPTHPTMTLIQAERLARRIDQLLIPQPGCRVPE